MGMKLRNKDLLPGEGRIETKFANAVNCYCKCKGVYFTPNLNI
jgi:hypothetical protein